MNPLETEKLFTTVQQELETAGSERVQLFCIYRFLEKIEGHFVSYDSYLIQLFQYFPKLNNPLLFTGIHPNDLERAILLFEKAIESVPELRNKKPLQTKINHLHKGLQYVKNWVGIRTSGVSDSISVIDIKWGEKSVEASKKGVFIPVIEPAGNHNLGRLRNLSVKLTEKSKSQEFSIQPVFGVIGAYAGQVGETAAKAAGNLLQETTGSKSYWSATAHFELMHTWHAGRSANLAIAGLFYGEMLRKENQREYFQLNPGIAITGDIDEQGNVLEVDESTLFYKVKAAFFSWVQVLVVPACQIEEVENNLRILQEEFPDRHLVVKGVGHIRELFYDRRLSLHFETSLIEHSVKRIWDRKNNVAVLITILILLAVIGRLSLGPVDKNVTHTELSGNTILLKNSTGSTVKSMEVSSKTATYLEIPGNLENVFQLYDYNGDGINEVFFGEGLNASYKKNGEVRAWSITGDSLIWSTELDVDVSFPRQQGLDEVYFFIDELKIAHSKGQDPVIIVRAEAGIHFPSMIAKLEIHSGSISSSYIHIGNINDMEVFDLDGDGTDEVLGTGINNAYWKASIFTLDLDKMDGHSPTQGDYILKNTQKANERDYVLIPKSIVGRVYDKVFKYTSGILLRNLQEKKELTVRVLDVPEKRFQNVREYGYLIYAFDYDFNIKSIFSSDYYDIKAKNLHDEGFIPFVPDYDYWEAFKDSLWYWDGKQFVTGSL